jgi:hypothetical protein
MTVRRASRSFPSLTGYVTRFLLATVEGRMSVIGSVAAEWSGME